MMWFFAVLIVLALGGIALVAAGYGRPIAEVYDDRPDAVVPADRPLTGDDLRRVRFSSAAVGYRMSEVDELLDRLAVQLDLEVEERPDSGEEGAPDDRNANFRVDKGTEVERFPHGRGPRNDEVN